MKIAHTLSIIILFLAANTGYAQRDGTIDRIKDDDDSSSFNLKISGGVTLYSVIDPFLSRGEVSFKNGYAIGLIVTLSEICELEGSFTFIKSNSGANTNGLISNLGLRLNVYRSDLNIFTGIGMSLLSCEETRNCGPYGCGPMGDPAISYGSLTLPIGAVYKLNSNIELELNSRLSIIFPEFQTDRITHTLGIIVDI